MRFSLIIWLFFIVSYRFYLNGAQYTLFCEKNQIELVFVWSHKMSICRLFCCVIMENLFCDSAFFYLVK